jgi:hypothetical protein
VPAYAEVANAYNARVRRLERLQAGVSMIVRAPKENNELTKDQVQGNLSMMLPSSVALRLDAYSKTIFRLGSNEERYWWIDLTKHPKVAMVGAHSAATPERVSAFGLPVHPLDLIEVFAIKPLPEPGTPEAGKAELAWSPDGQQLGLTLPGRWGKRRFWLDPKTYSPGKIELMDEGGQTVVLGTIDGFQQIAVEGDTTVHPYIPKKLELELPLQEATVLIETHDATNPGPRQRVQVFNLQTVLASDGVDKVVDIDRQ